MTALALDLGTTLGFCVFDENKLLRHGSIQLKSKPGKYNRYEEFLCSIFNSQNIETIYYEKVRRHSGVDAAHVYGGFEAILQKLCFSYNIPLSGIPVKTIKKIFTGNGNASKQRMMEVVAEIYQLQVSDDNEADAIALAHTIILADK